MIALKVCVGMAYTAFVAMAGMYWQVVETNRNFEHHVGVSIANIYDAKARCEKLAGEGNCRIVGGFMPKPQPVIVVPPSNQKPQGRDV